MIKNINILLFLIFSTIIFSKPDIDNIKFNFTTEKPKVIYEDKNSFPLSDFGDITYLGEGEKSKNLIFKSKNIFIKYRELNKKYEFSYKINEKIIPTKDNELNEKEFQEVYKYYELDDPYTAIDSMSPNKNFLLISFGDEGYGSTSMIDRKNKILYGIPNVVSDENTFYNNNKFYIMNYNNKISIINIEKLERKNIYMVPHFRDVEENNIAVFSKDEAYFGAGGILYSIVNESITAISDFTENSEITNPVEYQNKIYAIKTLFCDGTTNDIQNSMLVIYDRESGKTKEIELNIKDFYYNYLFVFNGKIYCTTKGEGVTGGYENYSANIGIIYKENKIKQFNGITGNINGIYIKNSEKTVYLKSGDDFYKIDESAKGIELKKLKNYKNIEKTVKNIFEIKFDLKNIKVKPKIIEVTEK